MVVPRHIVAVEDLETHGVGRTVTAVPDRWPDHRAVTPPVGPTPRRVESASLSRYVPVFGPDPEFAANDPSSVASRSSPVWTAYEVIPIEVIQHLRQNVPTTSAGIQRGSREIGSRGHGFVDDGEERPRTSRHSR